jgi:hypothetical protein
MNKDKNLIAKTYQSVLEANNLQQQMQNQISQYVQGQINK